MLNAYHGEFNQENLAQLAPHSLDELNSLIDHLAAAKTVSSYPGRARGHHAWIIVSDHGFNLEIYFGESTKKHDTVDFVLYGPYAPGDQGNIYDGRGLDGVMTITCLKTVLGFLDKGNSPVEFVKEHGEDVSIVSD